MLDAYDSCIKCSLCVAACPVYAVDPAFAGPKSLGPEWYRIFESGGKETDPSADSCTFCQLCEAACPVGVPVAHLIAKHKEQRPRPARVRIRDYGLTHPQWLARVPEVVLVPKVLARPAGISVKARWPRPDRAPRGRLRSQAGTAVGVWVDCFTRGFDGHVLEATVALLELWGYRGIPVPDRSACCGAAAMASGRMAGSERAAAAARNTLAGLPEGIDTLVTLNATCDATLREEWDPPLGIEVVPFAEFALRAGGEAFFERLASVEAGESLYFHATCRSQVSRGSGAIGDLCRRSGAEATPLGIACCGAAGSYAFKREHEEVSQALGVSARASMGESGSATLLVDSGPCAVHLADLTGAKAEHPAAWLYSRFNESERQGVN